MGELLRRSLGSSGIEVSVLALGSWQTYENVPREQALAVMTAAREAGIDFLDDARYDDRTGHAPIPTGYSEVLFGELFRSTGWNRAEVTVSNKLWWEFWPDESAARELEGSLGRMRFDHVDLIYATPPPDGLEISELVSEVAGLIDAGKARAWGICMWKPGQIEEAARVASDGGFPPPCVLQEAYNVAWRSPIEDDEMTRALEAAAMSVVGSASLAFGALTCKYEQAGARGRLADELDNAAFGSALEAAPRLGELADRLETTPAALAIAFSLANPLVAAALFGATRPEQVAENAEGGRLLERLTDDDLEELRGICG